MQKGDEIIILDYKTGMQVPKNANEVSLTYLLQLKVYAELVRRIYPHFTVRCAILWTHNAQLMWLDEPVSQAVFPPINSMVKSTVAA